MRKVFIWIPLFLLLISSVFGQIPAGYYDAAVGLSGENLRSVSKSITKNGHVKLTYDAVWNAYVYTDVKPAPDNTIVWDMYTDVPGGTSVTNLTVISGQCGTSGSSEGICYSREHSLPNSWWGHYDNAGHPQYTDLHHLFPSDQYVNLHKSNYPLGETTYPTYTSNNGSKVGPCSFTGYTGIVFEPIDDYKGDFARAYLYMATRYMDSLGAWVKNFPLTEAKYVIDTTNNNYKNWFVNMLLTWDNADPVSAKEINRNNVIYYNTAQHNRNPFIDHPEFVQAIWGTPVIKQESSNHVSNFQATNVSPLTSTITLTWIDASGSVTPDGYLIRASTVGFDQILNPTDGVPENISSMQKKVFQGEQTVTFTDLTPGTFYFFKIFPLTNGSSNINYKINGSVPKTSISTYGTIAAWDFTGVGSSLLPSFPATTFNTNLVSSSGASNITRGATSTWSIANNSFRTVGFKNEGISTSNTDYFQITIKPSTGYNVSLYTIDAKFAGTGSFYASPGVTSQFAYSLDGTNFTLIGSPVQSTSQTMTQISLKDISALQNVAAGTTITLRYYASGQTTSGGWGFNSTSSGTNGLAIGGNLAYTPGQWTGASSNNWSNTGNWSGQSLPTAESNVIIPSSAIVHVNLTPTSPAICNNLTICSGASLIIDAGKALTVNGVTSLNSAECLIIKSDATATGSFIDNGTITGSGTAKIEKYIAVNIYGRTVSAPIKNAEYSIFSAADYGYAKYYNPLDISWHNLTSGTMSIMKGYFTRFSSSDATLAFSNGNLFTDTITYKDLWRTGTGSGSNHGWNFIGNPYPSAINWDNVVTLNGGSGSFKNNTKLINSIYISDGNGGYNSYINGVGIPDNLVRIVPPATAFWVHVHSDYINAGAQIDGARLSFDNTVRVHQNSMSSKTSSNLNIIRLSISNNNYSDGLVVRFEKNATSQFDPQFDAFKMLADNVEYPQIYSISNDDFLSINSISDDLSQPVIVTLGFSDVSNSSLTIHASDITEINDDISIYLEDKRENKFIDLKQQNSYSFNSSISEDNNRFALHLSKVDAVNTNVIYSYENAVYLNILEDYAEMTIYNMLGQQLLKQEMNQSGLHKINLNVKTGCYFVTLKSSKCSIKQKVFINNL